MTAEQIVLPSGPKPLSVSVTVHDGQAVLHLSEPREYVALTMAEPVMLGARLFIAAVEAQPDIAQAAIAGAMGAIDGIYDLRGDIKPAGGAVKHELIERHRKTLVKRIEIMLNGHREKKKVNNAVFARQLTETALSEVFK